LNNRGKRELVEGGGERKGKRVVVEGERWRRWRKVKKGI